MSPLLKKQHDFALAIAKLIIHANEIGLPVTVGDAYRDPRLHGAMGIAKGYGTKNSCHKMRLAVDLNLVVAGKLVEPEAYAPLHDYWDSIGGAKRIDSDMNHFSFEHEGFR